MKTPVIPSILHRTPKLTAVTHCTAPTRNLSSCPFKTLGLKNDNNSNNGQSSQITYEQVRTAFRKLALQHHPDTSSSNSVHSNSNAKFHKIKDAFDAIVEGPDGSALLRQDSSRNRRRRQSDDGAAGSAENNTSSNNNSQVNNTFLHSSLNPSILREVAKVAEEMSPGGLDRGGMWQFAQMVRHHEEHLPPLQVESSSSVGDEMKKRRRRKK